jgi:anti-anti-sigma factor
MVDEYRFFAVHVEMDHDDCRVVLSGEVDLAAVPELFAALQEADRIRSGQLIVLLHDVTLVDSSGLGVFARLAAAGVHMELRGATGVVRRAIDISGLGLTYNIHVVDDGD